MSTALAAVLPLLSGACGVQEEQAEQGPWERFEELLSGGRLWLALRYRFEDVDQDGFSKEAHASTLRTVLGYETAGWQGFSGLLELEDVSPIGNELYDSTVNGETDRPVVADPNTTEINQAYLHWKREGIGEARAGRQRIVLDNRRFVGNVGWRQNEQTFDAASAGAEVAGFRLFYAFLENVERVFGDDSPQGDHRMASHLLHAERDFEGLGRLSLYGYLLDYDAVDNLSTDTWGARFAGRHDLASLGLSYSAEAARQTDAGDNPSDVDADYLLFELGGEFRRVTALAGYELLEGSGDPGDKLTTPLATLHAFQGWADQFLTTPDTGIEERYLSLGAAAGPLELQAVYHQFDSDTGGLDYGSELDLLCAWPIRKNLTLGVKAADYDADDFSVDTRKLWLWIEASFP